MNEQYSRPQETDYYQAARDVGKWLNERPDRPLDLRHVAMLAYVVQHIFGDSGRPVPVPQFRVEGTTDWYDGHPDPTNKVTYEERVLYSNSSGRPLIHIGHI